MESMCAFDFIKGSPIELNEKPAKSHKMIMTTIRVKFCKYNEDIRLYVSVVVKEITVDPLLVLTLF